MPCQDAPCCLRVLSRLLLLKPREAALHLARAGEIWSVLGEDVRTSLHGSSAGLELALLRGLVATGFGARQR